MAAPLPLQAVDLRVFRGGCEVLRGVSFAVAAGEVFGLLGGNGAGKSTTLASFLGFVAPTSGQVRVHGREVGADLAAARRAMAYLPEAATLYEHLDARENLRYFLQLTGEVPARSALDAAIEAALDRVALPVVARGRRMASYSKGMRQKVAIALALLRDTGILLLDEPTSGLDPTAIDEFHALVRGLAEAASGPAFAGAVGLLLWGAGEGRPVLDIAAGPVKTGGAFRRLIHWLKDRV
jgi:ABC-2 type transport system ATP-binding protein